MRPDNDLLELEKQFVRLRISNMADIDVGKFDFDFDTTFAILVLSKDGEIISRYGGRDSKSAESFVSIPSMKKAVSRSLDLHRKSLKGDVKLPDVLTSRQAQTYPFIKSVAARCVHCHDVASAQAFEKFDISKFNIKTDIWIHPEPIKLGLDLDPEDGVRLRSVSGAAKAAGFKAGDRIEYFNKVPVSTFTDIQYQLHRLPSDVKTVEVKVKGKGSITLKLSKYWNHSDISWRRLGIRLNPSAGFGGDQLTVERKKSLKLPITGFATEVDFINFPKPDGSPLKAGDIVYSVNGVKESPLSQHAALFISLTHKLNEVVKLGVIRDDVHQVIELKVSEGPSEGGRVMDSDARGRGMMRNRDRNRRGRRDQ